MMGRGDEKHGHGTVGCCVVTMLCALWEKSEQLSSVAPRLAPMVV